MVCYYVSAKAIHRNTPSQYVGVSARLVQGQSFYQFLTDIVRSLRHRRTFQSERVSVLTQKQYSTELTRKLVVNIISAAAKTLLLT